MEANSPKPSSGSEEPAASTVDSSTSSATPTATAGPEKLISGKESNAEPTIMEELSAMGAWCTRNPVATALILSFLAFYVWMFGFYKVFFQPAAAAVPWMWAVSSDNPDEGHLQLVPFISLGLLWIARYRLKEAAGKGSNWGLLLAGAGAVLFVISIRCLQPRMALASIPFLILGCSSFLWGNKVARILLFPACFLFFMIPVAALSQATFELQFLITGIVGFLSKFLGIGIQAMGTTLTAVDGSFNFEIAEGCSGIRSLAAMTMLTAVYVYLTQDRLWKQIVIFSCSLLFAVIGNVGRIFVIVLTARYYDPEFAAGMMHDYSGYVFFPIAVMAMLAFAKGVNSAESFVKRLSGKSTPSTPAATTGGAQ